MCILSYVLTLTLKVQNFQQDVLAEAEFPLVLYVRRVKQRRFRCSDAMNLWVRRHLFMDEISDSQWVLLLDYVRAPAQHKSNHSVALCMQRFI